MDNQPETKTGSKKELIGFISALAVMVIAIIVVWQVFLKGKTDEEMRNNKDTVIQTIVDTVMIKDSTLKLQNQTTIHKETKQEVPAPKKDTSKTGLKKKMTKDLTEEEKAKLKDIRERRKKSIVKQRLKKEN